MRFLDNRAIQIATGTIVMLIVSIVVLGLALTLTYNVFCAAEDMTVDISNQNRQQIDRLLTAGGRVVVPDNSREARVQGSFICGSSRSQAVDFRVGIQNRGQESNQFDVTISFEGAFDSQGNQLENVEDLFDNSHILASISEPQSDAQQVSHTGVNIPNGQSLMGTFIINLPLNAPSGQYQYSVRVITGSDLYGAQMAYVIVP